MNQLVPESEEISHVQSKVQEKIEQIQQNVKNGLVVEEMPGCKMKGNYVNGKKVGKWTLEYTDRTEEGEFNGKFKVGEWIVTYTDKQLIEQGHYDNLNLRTGEWTQREFQHTEKYYKLQYNRGKVQKKIEVNLLVFHSQILKH